jgi:hypothetical protein
VKDVKMFTRLCTEGNRRAAQIDAGGWTAGKP